MKMRGIVLVVLAAVFWGISGGIGDILMGKGWSPLVISFYRGGVGLILFAGWWLVGKKEKPVFTPPIILFSVLAGAGVAGNFTFYFFAIEASSIAVAATLMYTAPVFVLLTENRGLDLVQMGMYYRRPSRYRSAYGCL
ncbi:Uncharacterized membrane protein [Salimicrobium salexigens]|uniref:Uncharacterized membrane protein n=1 Tax=Salimicrobium salexigens TaxID=908941 RepID=A0ABY1KL20_9BACI|nr:Uncharacterized membrane protein [Salimicrobium salexigens]